MEPGDFLYSGWLQGAKGGQKRLLNMFGCYHHFIILTQLCEFQCVRRTKRNRQMLCTPKNGGLQTAVFGCTVITITNFTR